MGLSSEKNSLYYVTSSAKKCKRAEQFLPDNASFRLEQVDVHLFEEQTDDQQAIALAKAHQAWGLVQKPLLINDGGIYFHKYKNFPGTFAKYVYQGLGIEGICRLMDDGDELSVKTTDIVMWGPDQYKIFTIEESGTFKEKNLRALVDTTNATSSFFENMFVPHGFNQTYTELEQQPEIYNQIYYRSIAMKQIVEFVNNNSAMIFKK